jgi:hypothetical protein
MGEAPSINADKSKSYTSCTLQYMYNESPNIHQLGVDDANLHTLFVFFESSTDADSFDTAVNATFNLDTKLATISLGDLADVTLTDAAEDEVLKLNDADIWVNAADATS